MSIHITDLFSPLTSYVHHTTQSHDTFQGLLNGFEALSVAWKKASDLNARNQKRQKELNHDILVYELNIKKVIFGKLYSMIKVLKLFSY